MRMMLGIVTGPPIAALLCLASLVLPALKWRQAAGRFHQSAGSAPRRDMMSGVRGIAA